MSKDHEDTGQIRLKKEWYSLKECCELKGIHIKTARNNPWLQPNNGKYDATVGKRKRWHRYTVQDWLEKKDWELAQIAARENPASIFGERK